MDQQVERKEYIQKLLNSKESKRLVVAGPGTGKTFTFSEILNLNPSGNNLVLTFIRKLVADMDLEFGDKAEVKTFHAYCKKVLHEIFGYFELAPTLTKIIKFDSEYLQLNYDNFDSHFQLLESGEEIDFYLKRGDYYKVLSFNDSVYRLYNILLKDSSVIDKYDTILIDEFQDFNPLEVAFIKEIEKKGSIVIVGDDDQAVYSGRNSSAIHLRELYHSGNYALFELPFCSRCPKVIVDAVNFFIQNIKESGGLDGRLARRFEAFLPGKEYENERYTKIIKARLTTIKVLSPYLKKEIENIPAEDIQDSYNKISPYPTVLIIGQRQYLSEVAKSLKPVFPNIQYSFSTDIDIEPVEVYKFFITNKESNYSWRLLLHLYFDDDYKKSVIEKSVNGHTISSLLDSEFIEDQNQTAEILLKLLKERKISDEDRDFLKGTLLHYYDDILEYFLNETPQEEEEIDESNPSILLTSFEGCKGLSAGHVFIVGANNGSIPKIKSDEIDDVECSKFIVALTRTRKCCHIISNKWLYSPRKPKTEWAEEYEESFFTSFISKDMIEDKGLLKSADFK